ncbi:MAG: methyl-accepting chemotaxis protein [Succinivibrionaceae bacterium]|nr:methyl-accepting chemotaxis protein [Succinivibrionaceae bacterium]
MSLFSNLKVGYKVLLCFSVIIVLTLIQGVAATANMSRLSSQVKGLNAMTTGVIIPATDLKAQFRQLRIYAIRITSGNERLLQEYDGKIKTQLKETADTIREMTRLAKDEATLSNLKDLSASLERYSSIFTRLYAILTDKSKSIEKRTEEAFAITKVDMKQVGNDADSEIMEILAREKQNFTAAGDEIERNASPWLTVSICLLCVALAVFFTLLLSKSFGSRANRLVQAANRVADCDLTVEVKSRSHDEIGNLTASIGAMIHHLRDIIAAMTGHSSTIGTAVDELERTSRTISESTSQILNQTLAVSAASEEMAATPKEIANNCNAAAVASEETKNTTHDSIESVRSTVAKIREHSRKTEEDARTIAKLGDETKQIDTIIATIQDIANQTNLLALNAAIEAARAGEHGRGFAVVSDEVRALANRTAQSTQEINKMIKAVQDEVEDANRSFAETVTQMEEIAAETEQIENSLDVIVGKVNDVNSQINQIAVATEEQTATSVDMSANLQKIAMLTKDVSANADDTLKATETMTTLSQEIIADTGKFRL